MKKSVKVLIVVMFFLMLFACIGLVTYELARPRTEAELELYHSCENLLESEAKFYVTTNDSKDSIIKKDELKEDCHGCKYYVEWDQENNTFKSYISCRGYETEGFNKDKLK